MNEDIYSKLSKLKKLAEQGYYGESKNAKALIDKLVRKYGILESELNKITEQPIKEYSFGYKNDLDRRILQQIIWMVTNDTNIYVRRWVSNKHIIKRYYINCTKIQATEIDMLYDFYKRIFEQELDLFVSAFIQKHNLFGTSSEEDDNVEKKKRTREEYMRMYAYEMGMQDVTPHKQIEGKKNG